VLLAKLDDSSGKDRADPRNGDQQLFVGLMKGMGLKTGASLAGGVSEAWLSREGAGAVCGCPPAGESPSAR
jgi:hypothetical protein